MGNYLSKLQQGRIYSLFDGDLGIPNGHNGAWQNSLWSSTPRPGSPAVVEPQKHVRGKASTYVRPNYVCLNNLYAKRGWPSKSAVHRLGLTNKHRFKYMTVVINKPMKKE